VLICTSFLLAYEVSSWKHREETRRPHLT